MSKQPIGIFDSGVGGLSIFKVIKQHLPNENLLYFADSQYAPYGELDEKILKQRCLFIADFFIQKNAKAMVVACNTATALMAEWLRAEYDIPIIAIEPAIKPAAQITTTNTIGVFATQHTLNSERYRSLLKRFAKDKTIYQSACEGFVEQVEKGELDSLRTIGLIEQYLLPMLDNNIDTLVLGCTHYPFLSETIKLVAGQHPLTIIDNANAVSLQATRVLTELGLLNLHAHESDAFFSSSNSKTLPSVFSDLLLKNTHVNYIAD
ncbi:glutamate racemase [Kangiella sp. HZ709]|uniref:glutamate racemase n=1 Tax=Kangiella sp. HZ709 TaxID=2666328 RepID=UPI0012AFD780|nr:glutamate racemase [Kangiella sp. HZ709]MRX28044.1 glutamate racemase [Kangiella sp. HZ709]